MAFMVSLIISISVLIAMSFVPAILVLSLTEEQVNKSKHLQIISGMKPVVYWLSNFAWDMCNYLVSAGLVVLIFLCFQKKAYVSSDNLPALILLLVLYGWSVTPMMYPASFFFSVPSTAYVTLMFVNLFIGINTVVATYMLEYSENPELKRNSNMLKQYFLILPPYCLGSGMMDLAKNQHMADAYVMYDLYKFVPPLSRKIVGKHLLAMTVSGVIFFTFTVLMEYQFFIRLLFPPSKRGWFKVEDEDVANERKRITSRKLKEDILVLHSLTKIYWMSEKPAVDRLCLGIPRGECFGLLGVNGAGKTSTFQMLTGETLLTAGDASLKGYSIITNIRNFHKNIGYCPQCNPIHDLLTGRENLVFYCRLRGMPEDEIPGVVKLGLSTLGLMQYADKPTGQYSGGNKRKLCMAIALIGAPPVIFLDEPTTGIDPHAKWLLWNCIIRLIKDGKSVVLSSHSPEECEALCTRMAIMGKGRFLCLGTVQHLKNKFGDGYTITLRISGTNPDTGPLEKFMEDSFPDIILKEKYHTILQYQLPSHICSLAKVFDILSANWSNYNIRDYSISQTALDQVFLHFVKEQSHYYWSDNTEGPASLWKCILG